MAEQANLLTAAGIDFEIVPGVTTASAAAAAFKVSFTVPEATQTLILTRLAGRTPMPVHPTLDAVAGVLAYRSVDTLPLTPDLAVICTEPDSVPDCLRALGRRGVGAAVVLPPGYAKLPRERRRDLQARMSTFQSVPSPSR